MEGVEGRREIRRPVSRGTPRLRDKEASARYTAAPVRDRERGSIGGGEAIGERNRRARVGHERAVAHSVSRKARSVSRSSLARLK
jgi:hypothetical protein